MSTPSSSLGRCFHLGGLSPVEYHQLCARRLELLETYETLRRDRAHQEKYWMKNDNTKDSPKERYVQWYATVVLPLAQIGPFDGAPLDPARVSADWESEGWNAWHGFFYADMNKRYSEAVDAFCQRIGELDKVHDHLMPRFFTHMEDPCYNCALCCLEAVDSIDNGADDLCYLCARVPVDSELRHQAPFPVSHMCRQCAALVARRGGRTCGFCRGLLNEQGACTGRGDWKKARQRQQSLRSSLELRLVPPRLESPSTI